MPPITDELIAAQVSERSAARGRAYADNGAIVDGEREGGILRAACHGSRSEPYRVEVLFDDLGIAEARCTCPVGAEGQCKHVAALLFTYRDEPSEFAAIAELDELLVHRSQDELIDLIKRLVWRQPALIDMVLHAPRQKTSPVNGTADPVVVSQLELPRIADSMPTAGSPDAAVAAEAEPGSAAQAEPEGDTESESEAEKLARLAEQFVARPGFAAYKSARAVARSLGCWSLLEPIFQAAVAGPRHRDLRIRMCLHEGQVEQALAALPPKILFAQWGVVDEVARSAEASYPATSRALYQQYIDALIQRRGRDNYRRACSYLERVRALYSDSDSDGDSDGDGEESWERYIAGLRERFSYLPALLDELHTAGL